MASTTGSDRMTAEQLTRLPDDGKRYELVDGVLRMMSPAGGRHGIIAARITVQLSVHVDQYRLGTVFAAETGFWIHKDPDTVRAPDVAFVCQERLDSLGDVVGYVPLAPDLAVEVVSPSDPYSEVDEKVRGWLQAGVRMVLVVDPATRMVRVQCGMDQAAVLDETMEIEGADVVPGWKVPVAKVFA